MIRTTGVWSLAVLAGCLMLIALSGDAHAQYEDPPHDPNSAVPVWCLSCHNIHEPSYPSLLGNYCDYCHFTGGPAPAVQPHSSTTSDNSYGNWDTDCWACHNPHNQEQDRAYATNHGKYIRKTFNAEEIKEIDPNDPGPYYPPISILRTISSTNIRYTGTSEFVDGDIEFDDDICRVCHVSTTNYNNLENTHSNYGADSQPGGNCLTCHPHDVGFAVSGGAGCTGCHGQAQPDPGFYRRQVAGTGGDFERASHHVTDGTTTEIVSDSDCTVCHNQSNHQANVDPGVVLNDADDGVTTYNYTGTGGPITDFCLRCHDTDGASAYGTTPFTGNNTPADIQAGWSGSSHATALTQDGCLSCHGGTDATRTETVTDRNVHGSATAKLLSLLVDGETAANDAEGLCFACHDTDGAASTDIEAAFNPSPAYSDTSASRAAIDQVHNPALCNDCHNPHLATTANPAADPDNLAQAFSLTYDPNGSYQGNNYYSSTSNFDPVNPAGAAGSAVGTVGPATADPNNNGNDTAVSNEGPNYTGSEDQTYTVEVTTGGQPPTAQITVTSTGTDTSGPTSVTAFGAPIAVGNFGATITFTEGGGTPSSIGPATSDPNNNGDDTAASGGTFTGGTDITYTVTVSQGGTPGGTYGIGAAACTTDCLDDTALSGGTYSPGGDPGNISYFIAVGTPGGSNIATLEISSTADRDPNSTVTWINGAAVAVGSRGVEITITDGSGQRTLDAGEEWQIDVTQTSTGPQITVTSTGGLDDSGPTDVPGFDSPVAVGTLGATITFTDGGDGVLTLDDIWTIAATAATPGDGLTLGDRWEIPVFVVTSCLPNCVEPDYVAYCLACHDGTPPADVAPLMDPDLINISSAYFARDQHGNQDGDTGASINKGYKKVPWGTQADYNAGHNPAQNYSAIQCTTCHEGHGSANLFHLRTAITVGEVEMQVGGKAGSQFDFITPSTTYELPLVGGVQQDHYWGAWCSFCHEMSNHPGVDESTSCQGGHMHDGGNF